MSFVIKYDNEKAEITVSPAPVTSGLSTFLASICSTNPSFPTIVIPLSPFLARIYSKLEFIIIF